MNVEIMSIYGFNNLAPLFQDGIVQPTDTALRDFSAKSLHDFLKWSIKQTKVITNLDILLV